MQFLAILHQLQTALLPLLRFDDADEASSGTEDVAWDAAAVDDEEVAL